jgi:hypothetical protein
MDPVSRQSVISSAVTRAATVAELCWSHCSPCHPSASASAPTAQGSAPPRSFQEPRTSCGGEQLQIRDSSAADPLHVLLPPPRLSWKALQSTPTTPSFVICVSPGWANGKTEISTSLFVDR